MLFRSTAVSKKQMSALNVLREMQTKKWTPAVGSNTLPTPNADLKRFYEQSLSEFITGKRTLNRANWNAWLEEFRKLGGQAWNDAGVASMKENNLLN